MSDYATPAVSDKSVENLAQAINSFFGEVSRDVQNINDSLAEVVNKYYTVNHEPQIELPFEAEYKYIHDKVDSALSGSKTLDEYTHIFISGYLPSGKTIHPNSIETDEQGHTVSKYSQLYINGVPYTSSDYTCRAEEGGWERLNVLIIGAPKMSPYNARLDADYADIPLKNFKMIVFDDLEEPTRPNIDSFIASQEIDTLKAIGTILWTYTEMSTLRRLELTKDIIVTGTMDCPCLQALIAPNVSAIPNISPSAWYSMTELDVENYNGDIANVNFPNLTKDLKLNCRRISGLKVNRPITVYVGNGCAEIANESCQGSRLQKLICGTNCHALWQRTFSNCADLFEVDLSRTAPLQFVGSGTFSGCQRLKTIKFSSITEMNYDTFSRCSVLANLSFAEKATSCNLYFGDSPVITEQSCLNIINAIADNAKIKVQLHATVKTQMTNTWYCKLSGGKYITCTAEDEGAVTQAAAILARGGTLT